MMVIKNLLKITVSLIALLLLPVGSWAACTGSSPTWNSTPDYSSVSSCVSQATGGDTVNVSAGSATWTSQLNITKGINLIGAGMDSVTITNGIGSSFLISYSSPSNSDYFRVSGFTFDMNSNGYAIYMVPSSEPTVPLIRIDHNRVRNCALHDAAIYYGGSPNGQVFGVIDNNIFDDVEYVFRANSAGSATWAAYPAPDGDRFHGTNLNIYVEDNVFNMPVTTDTDHWPQMECDFGARWALRYNTFNMQGLHWSFTDMHGGGMGAEMYGNYIANNNSEVHIIHDRGARVITHHNNIVGTADEIVKLSSLGCPADDRRDMNNTYHFQNRGDTTGTLVADFISREICSIPENSKYWMDNTDCIGGCSSISSGVGCGSTLPDNCTPSSDVTKGSTAFWLTDQSCTSLSGLTGASTEVSGGNRNPSSIIKGTLYICTATDTWTEWYTPYTYPHPLRGDSWNLRIIP